MRTTARSSVLLLALVIACDRDAAPPRVEQAAPSPCTTYEQRLADCPDDVRATLVERLATAKRTMTDKARLIGMCVHALDAIRGVCYSRQPPPTAP